MSIYNEKWEWAPDSEGGTGGSGGSGGSGGDPYEVVNSIIDGTIEEFISYSVGSKTPFYNDGAEYWSNLTTYIAPFVDGALSLRSCPKLTFVDTGITSVGTRWFLDAPLKAFVLRSTKLAPLSNVNSFTDSGIANGTGYIYVPRNLVDSYKAATNWTTYANQFRALEDYTVDGTITGELDESKI